jgi:hypothetical protein
VSADHDAEPEDRHRAAVLLAREHLVERGLRRGQQRAAAQPCRMRNTTSSVSVCELPQRMLAIVNSAIEPAK